MLPSDPTSPRRRPVLPSAEPSLPAFLAEKIERIAISALKPNPKNPRTHNRKQIRQLTASIRKFGFNTAILIGTDNLVVAGHGLLKAAELLGMTEVPVIRLDHLTKVEQRAFAIAHNRLGELSGWDQALLALEIQELDLKVEFDLEVVGFEGHGLEQLLGMDVAAGADLKADDIPTPKAKLVSQVGDLWVLGSHRLLCGDALDRASFERLMGEDRARMCFTDPPYNIAADQIGGKGKVRHGDFVMGSGEMSSGTFIGFLTTTSASTAAFCIDGAIIFQCMDWRNQAQILAAGAAASLELKNLVVWAKTNAGMGTFYRSQHELIFVFKTGSAPHMNTFGLGETGRHRSNLWSYPGLNAFGAGRDDDLAMHPTVKPVALVADAIRDVSRRGDIVLDPFGGSGTTLIAAERTRRQARLIELDPAYVDVICRRWEKFSGQPAVLDGAGLTFDEVARQRAAQLEAAE